MEDLGVIDNAIDASDLRWIAPLGTCSGKGLLSRIFLIALCQSLNIRRADEELPEPVCPSMKILQHNQSFEAQATLYLTNLTI